MYNIPLWINIYMFLWTLRDICSINMTDSGEYIWISVFYICFMYIRTGLSSSFFHVKYSKESTIHKCLYYYINTCKNIKIRSSILFYFTNCPRFKFAWTEILRLHFHASIYNQCFEKIRNQIRTIVRLHQMLTVFYSRFPNYIMGV